MKKLILLGLFVFLSLSFATFASAQTSGDSMPEIISMPKPEKSPEAVAAGAKGKVSVRVTVNTKGKVVKATVIRGNPLLREAARQAALKATFTPKIVNGKAFGFLVPLVYNFN